MPAGKASTRAGQWPTHVRTWLEAACSCLQRAGKAQPARARAGGSLAEVGCPLHTMEPVLPYAVSLAPGSGKADGEAETKRSLQALMTSAWSH